jgi:hypothetical protein
VPRWGGIGKVAAMGYCLLRLEVLAVALMATTLLFFLRFHQIATRSGLNNSLSFFFFSKINETKNILGK